MTVLLQLMAGAAEAIPARAREATATRENFMMKGIGMGLCCIKEWNVWGGLVVVKNCHSSFRSVPFISIVRLILLLTL